MDEQQRMWTEGESRGSLCFVRTANLSIGNFHDSNAKTLGSNKVRHVDGPPYHPPLWLKTRRLSNAISRENTTKCRPCHGSDAFDSNNYCFHFTLASVSESELLQVSLECSQCRSVGMSRAVLISISRSAKCDFLAVDISPFLHNLTLHSLKHLIVSRYLVKSGRCAF